MYNYVRDHAVGMNLSCCLFHSFGNIDAVELIFIFCRQNIHKIFQDLHYFVEIKHCYVIYFLLSKIVNILLLTYNELLKLIFFHIRQSKALSY